MNLYAGLDPEFRQILMDLGAPPLTSGYRSPAHNKRVGGAPKSMHQHRLAADVNMAGWSDEQRGDFLRRANEAGVTRFGTYTNSPNMLHIDMSGANGGYWPMHDRSKKNIHNAPAWLRNYRGAQAMIDPGNYHAATAAPGVAAQGQGPLVGVDPQTQGPLLAGGMPDGSLFGNPLLQAGASMLGAALTPGGPNPLAAGMAGYMAPQNAQRQFAREMATSRLSGAKLPENIREIEELKKRYPQLTEEQVLSMAFAGRVPGKGSKVVMVNEVPMIEELDQWGSPSRRMMTTEEKDEFDKAAAQSIGSNKTAAQEAQERVGRRRELFTVYQAAASELPQEIASRKRLLNAIKSGKLGSSVILSGTQQRFKSDVARLQAESMNQLLERLSKVSTGGLTEGEREAFRAGLVSPNNTDDVNISLLETQIQQLEREATRLSSLRREYSNPDFDPLYWLPEMQIGQEAPPVAPPAGVALPVPAQPVAQQSDVPVVPADDGAIPGFRMTK